MVLFWQLGIKPVHMRKSLAGNKRGNSRGTCQNEFAGLQFRYFAVRNVSPLPLFLSVFPLYFLLISDFLSFLNLSKRKSSLHTCSFQCCGWPPSFCNKWFVSWNLSSFFMLVWISVYHYFLILTLNKLYNTIQSFLMLWTLSLSISFRDLLS